MSTSTVIVTPSEEFGQLAATLNSTHGYWISALVPMAISGLGCF